MKFSFLFVAGMFAVFTCGMQNGDCVNSFCKTDINDETFCAAESDLLPDTPLLNKPEINSDLSAYFFSFASKCRRK